MVVTFLPFPDFQKSAQVLDYRRLNKQRLEAKQIIAVLEDPDGTKGWKNHPATLMWVGYTSALKLYYNEVVKEWISRGYKNTLSLFEAEEKVEMPWWLGYPPLHCSHQASLIRKDSGYYTSKFIQYDLTPIMAYTYIWPTKLTSEQQEAIKTSLKNKTPLPSYSIDQLAVLVTETAKYRQTKK